MRDYRCEPGTPIGDLDTPRLIVEMDALENNYRVAATAYRDTVCKMRQHTKNVKSPLLAKMQMEFGGSNGGVCTAKVAEAEVMVEGGITDVLIPNQIVTRDKLARLCALAKRGDIKICVDSVENVRAISNAASQRGVEIGILIEVDTSMGRAGVRGPRAAVDAARSGDTGAFETLVLRYQARIVNYASALVRDAGAAEDVAQETFVRAWRGLGRFRGESAFRTWLYRIAANVARTHLDRRGRQARVADGSLDDETEPLQADDVASAAPDAETSLVTRDAIDRALAELPDELRLALVLRDVEGLDYKEIAGVTGAPMGTVESRIFRARRHMRTLLRPLRTARPPRRGVGNGRSGPRGEDR